MKRAACWTVIALVVMSSVASADNWPAWRGPTYDGVAAGTGYPTEWSESKNVRWKIPLPGNGGSTPAIWEDSIFLTAGDEGKNAIICFDRQGEQRWKTHVGAESKGKHAKGSGANPSPTTDGQFVFAYFKSGDLACLNFEGQVIWQHNLQEMYGEDTLWWDLGTSPVLVNELVIVACIHSGPSYLAAFDKKTGDLVWKHDRDLPAPQESQQTYSTPIPTQIHGRDAVVVLGADHVTAHDAQTGDELWRVGNLNPEQSPVFRSIASPVIHEGVVVAPYARGESLTAIPLEGKGDLTSKLLWTKTNFSADVPTPAAKDGRLYLCTDRGMVACMDIKSGSVIWEGEVKRSGRAAYSASPVIADDKLYVTLEDGTTTVLQVGDEFKPLAENQIDEFVVATPVFADGQIFIRTRDHLYCISK